MRNKKVTKYIIGLIIIGIFLFFVRTFYYIDFLGSLLDGIWEVVFVIAIYDLTAKYAYTVIPLILGVGIEVFQYLAKEIGINTIGYYPGYADFNDVIAYFLGYALGILFIYIFYQRKKM